ncbi:MAG: flagellar biosynthesis protein FlhF [Armatimonadota bacterium]
MIVRCFEGRSMPEVMERVRQEMGEDAVILHTQQRRGLLWWFRKMPTIRVWAAVATNPRMERTDEKKRISRATLSETEESEHIQPSTLTVSINPPVFPPTDFNNGGVSKASMEVVSETPSEGGEEVKSPQRRRRRKQNDVPSDANKTTTKTVKSRRRSKVDKEASEWGGSEVVQRVEQQLQLLATSLWGQESVIPQTGALGMLWRCGIDLPTIQRLFSSQPPVPDPKTPTEKWLKAILKEHLPVTGGLTTKTNTAVLVGPTGVGKTTTVAKIAANQLMHHRRRVALVTVDVFRVGAVQQLETYARLMGLPFFVATTPEEARKCTLQARQVADLVLVDTIGRSPKHTEQLASLWELVAAMNPDEVLLTLPANGNPADLALAADQFSIFCPTSLIITKLDETTQTGVIVNLVTRLNLPVSYITTGQNVPEDLEVPTSERLAEWVLSPLAERSEVYEPAVKGVNGDA